MKIACLISAPIALALASPGPAQASPAALRWHQAAAAAVADYERALTEEHVVGGAVAILAAEGTSYRRNYGLLDKTAGLPVTDDTIFHWASVTKIFTSLAVMQLVERGKLSLKDPVTKYIPEFRSVHSQFGSPEAVTIEQLLSHSSGLRGASWPWNADGAKERTEWQPLEPGDWKQIAAMLPYTELEFAPGSRASYSNLGLLIAGEIVARVSGDSLETYVDKNILKPLEMYDSFFDATPWRLRPVRTHDYIFADNNLVDQGAVLDSGATAPNGGLNSTVGDIERVVRFLMGDKASYPIVRAETLQEMIKPRFEFQRDERRTVSVGLGFFISDERDKTGETHRYFGHAGFQRGNRSAISVSADGCCGLVFAANSVRRGSGNPSAGDLRIALTDTVFPALRQMRTKK